MEQIKAFIFRDNDSEKTITVIMEDGGVASSYNPDGVYYRTDYYQSRLTPNSNLNTVWDELAEGKMYAKDWYNSESDERLVDDMILWLYLSTEDVEIIKVEMGELTEETFEQVKQQIKFEQE
jgi:hypothetical protein